MSDPLRFTAAVYQNEYLPEDGDRVDAVVRFRAVHSGPVAAEPAAAEFVVLLDCSGSMSDPPTKLSEARRAAIAAVEALRDGVAFAVVAGTQQARMLYPAEESLVAASVATRAAAAAAIARARASGGTAIGRWLTQAEALFGERDGVVRHALLLTDGKNQHETADELGRALAQCENRFRCDCRALGSGGGADGWSAAELLRVSQALSGSVQNVEEYVDLPANLTQATAAAMAQALPDVRLRARTAEGTTLHSVKQVYPTINDLAGRGVDAGPRTLDHPTGPWGAEVRDYQLAFKVEPRAPGTSLRIAWVALAAGLDETVLTEVPVLARWTRDPRESTRINGQVAHYTDQAELAAAIQTGVEAYKQREFGAARTNLARAVQLAHASGHDGQLAQLARLVEIDDPAAGAVRLREDLDPTGMESAVLDSVRTTGFRNRPVVEVIPASAYGEVCPECGTPRAGRYCEQDGHDFEPDSDRSAPDWPPGAPPAAEGG